MRLKLISCEIFRYEVNAVIENSTHSIDVEFLPKALHDLPTDEMFQHLKKSVEESDNPERYDYILLAYGLCNNGTVNLQTSQVPMVIPRVHDCIGVLMGGRDIHAAYFEKHPGCYYLSTGWMDYDGFNDTDSIQSQLSMNHSYDYFLQNYGEENATFLYEQLSSQFDNYNETTYIRTGLKEDNAFEKQAEKKACRQGWNFSTFSGTLSYIEELLSGSWDKEKFILIEPGQILKPSYNNDIFTCERNKKG